jgi:transglutaminase-like putative cysteine protease
MRFHIHHTTKYRYSKPVFLKPHILRMYPRTDTRQLLEHYQVNVVPEPAGLSDGIDAENNCFSLVWFDGRHDHLEFKIDSEIKISDVNPFAGLLLGDSNSLPLHLIPDDQCVLESFLIPEAMQTSLTSIVKEVMQASHGRTLDFLQDLNQTLNERIEQIVRPEPGLQSTEETLQTCKGACRDMALVFIMGCRHVGIPARFVSGYYPGQSPTLRHDLHAWAEVYLPGFGWCGYDPTCGLAVSGFHIAVAAAALPRNAAPVTGAYLSDDIDTHIEHTIIIK